MGNVTQYAYDNDGRLTSTTDPLQGVTSNTYDADGNKISRTDPLGNVNGGHHDAVVKTAEVQPCADAHEAITVNDSSTGWSHTSGTWTQVNGGGYPDGAGSGEYQHSRTANASATWTFSQGHHAGRALRGSGHLGGGRRQHREGEVHGI